MIGTVGTAIIVVAAAENHLIKKGKFVESEIMGNIIHSCLATGGVIASIWFILSTIGRFIL